jgi:hypothetical protein
MQQTQWSPSTIGIIGCGVFGAALAAAAVTAITDAPGRVLAGIAAVGLLVFAIMSWRARPKLAITEAGVLVRGWFSKRVLTKSDIDLIRITEFRRLARKVRLLEVETVDDQLYVFTRWDLGTDPLRVLDVLTDAGYAGRK